MKLLVLLGMATLTIGAGGSLVGLLDPSATVVTTLSPIIPRERDALLGSARAELRTAEDPSTASPEAWCRAQEKLERALTSTPFEARLLMAWSWVTVRVPANAPCAQTETLGRARATVEVAVLRDRLAPVQVLFEGARLREQFGDRQAALALYQEIARRGVGVTSAHIKAIIATVTSEEEVATVLPSELPHITPWSRLLRQERPHLAYPLAQLQQVALAHHEKRWQSDELPATVAIEQLVALIPVIASPEVQRIVDRQLSQLYRQLGERDLAALFLDRERLSRPAVVRAVLRNDRVPTASTFTRWGGEEVVYLDEANTSIGAFVSGGATVNSIHLLAQGGAFRVDLTALSLFESSDNRSWSIVPFGAPPRRYGIGPAGIVTLTPRTPLVGPFIKVHFAAPRQDRQLANTLDLLLTLLEPSAVTIPPINEDS